MNWLTRTILDSAPKERGRFTKSLFTGQGLVVFGLLVPASCIALSLALDRLIGLDALGAAVSVEDRVALAALTLPLLLAGAILVVWTTIHQLRFSGGTPAFKAPPRRLLTDGPFALCRNPMILGYLLFYYALAVVFASPVALLLVVPTWNVIAWYVVTRVEEVELSLRFGEAYESYRRRVGRILPLRPRRPRPAIVRSASGPRSLEFAEETSRTRGYPSNR